MMYGFGDSSCPNTQSVHLMEDLVVDYLQLVLQQACRACEERLSGTKMKSGAELKVKERDLLFVLRKDLRRYRRVQLLLEIFKEQKEANQRPDYAKDD